MNPTDPIPLNGATLAAFTVEQPGDVWARVTVTRESGEFVVRRDGQHIWTSDDATDAIACALYKAGWLGPVCHKFAEKV